MIKGIIFDFNRTLYDPSRNELITNAMEILEKLRSLGYKLSLISFVGDNHEKEQLIHCLGITDYFDKIVLTEEEKTKVQFKECIQAMDLAPSEVAVVGDRVKEEITIGNQLGMTTIWLKSGKFSEELSDKPIEKPTMTVNSLKEVLGCLMEMR